LKILIYCGRGKEKISSSLIFEKNKLQKGYLKILIYCGREKKKFPLP
jgi:hypothetical protein